MNKNTLLFLSFLLCLTLGLQAQDNDGDGVLDPVDLDDDNDGILDINECEVPISEFSFESLPLYLGTPNWVSTGANFGWGNHDIDANNYLTTGGVPDGNQFLFLTTQDQTGSLTLDFFSKTFEEGTYTLTVAVGDGIADRGFDNDGQSIIEIGYGEDAATFVPLAQAIVDGDTTAPGTWTDVQVPIVIADPNAALGQGILVRITHTGTAVPSGTNTAVSARGHYDNIRLTKDTDGDGLSDCFDLDSDFFDPTNDPLNFDCPDVLEAGHINDGNGLLQGGGVDALTGQVTGFATGYTGNTEEVINAALRTCDANYLDNDEDNVDDFTDLDDDNDGILDTNECEVNIANPGFEDFDGATSFLEDWSFSGTGTAGQETVIDGTNYFNAPEGNAYAFINNNASITLDAIANSFELGDYTLSLLVGDGIDFNNAFRNDGQSTIELGYFDGALTFQPVGTLVVENYETVNGTWTEFSLTVSINGGDAALGQPIAVRIGHAENALLRQSQGNYDRILVTKDTDRDGLSDCFDLDSDDPTNSSGCFDVLEAGHIDAGNGVLGSLPNIDGVTGQVTGFATGYTGNTEAVLDNTIETCAANYLDNDTDGTDDFTDLDDDNDGILDAYECEIPIANFGFEDFDIPRNYLADWFSSGGISGQETVIDGTNYLNAPEGVAYAFLNGDETITLNTVFGTYEEGNYQLRILVGDGIDTTNPFRNDGQSIIELGYHDGDYLNFQPITNGVLTIENYETVNGTWTEFVINGEVNAGDPALGQAISVQITHNENANSSQSQGNYDFLRIYRDRDGDGTIDCFDLDSDGDGCDDAAEAVTSAGNVGPTSAMWDANINSCNTLDTDGDGELDGDYFRYDAGDNLLTNIDLDNDNDGISDADEGCNLLDNGIARERHNFDIQPNPDILSTGNPFSGGNILDFWEGDAARTLADGSINHYIVNSQLYAGFEGFNFFTDGTGLPDLADQQNDTYLSIRGNRSATQQDSNIILEEGTYLITIAVGDPLDYENQFLNDGISTISVGYDTDPFAFGVTYNNIQTFPQINPEDTPNGVWTDFAYNFTIPAGSPAIGNELTVRIEHTTVTALNQDAGNYDHIRVQWDYDADGIPDCLDADSDDDGCADVIEAGYTDENNDTYLDPYTFGDAGAVNGNGEVVGGDNTTPVLPDVRDFSLPATIVTPLANQTICENDNVTLTVVADRPPPNPTIVYEWFESTDGGTTFNPLTDAGIYSGTTTDAMTITGVTDALNNNQYRVRVMGDDHLCYEESIAILTVTAGPTPPTVVPVNPVVCEGDDAEFTITGDPNNTVTYSFDGGTTAQTVTLDGAGNATVSELGITVDTTIELLSVEDTVTSCLLTLAPPADATVTVSPPPTLTVDLVQCDIPSGTYFVEVTASSGTVTADFGTVVGNNRIENIPDGTDVNITLTDGPCVINQPITAPDCTCPIIDPPINPIDGAVCEGQPNTPISIDLDPAGLGDTINWYDAAVGGTQVGTGLTFTSTETAPGNYSYYAEAVEAATNCSSTIRIEVVFTINATVTADVLASPINECDQYILPPLSAGNNYFTGSGGSGTALTAGDVITTSQTIFIYAESGTVPNCTDESSFDVVITPTPSLTADSRVCSTDRTTYTVNFTPSSATATVTADFGAVVGNTVTGVPAGTDVTLIIAENGCVSTITVISPDCTCPILNAPTNPINALNCEGGTDNTLFVDAPSAGNIINWYDAAVGGNLVGTGNSFTPVDILPGVYSYYAETVEAVSLCTSDTRTEVILSVIARPVADVLPDVSECLSYVLPLLNPGNQYYTETQGGGTLLNAGDAITTTQEVYIYAVGTLPNCSDESSFIVTITPPLEQPENPINGGNCVGEPTASLSVSLPSGGGDTINWYDAAVGGTLLATGTIFTPVETIPGTYSYYAETEDSVSGCISERIEVVLTISEIPVVDTMTNLEACEQYILPALSANNFYYTGPNGTGQQLFTGDALIDSQTVYILATNPENTDCTDESSFDVTILNEPAIALPETAALCEASGQTVELGIDLGPQYRYDWTPDNDTDNDGVEEPVFTVTEAGTYSLRIYQIGATSECGGSVTYTTEIVETLQALSVEVDVTADGFELNTGNRALAIVNNDNLLFDQFEYSLDSPTGPFQAQNYFENIPGGLHRIYVRGLFDCGSVIESAPFLIVNYPTVFTPNGDGTNETWNILGTDNPNITDDVRIQIFDRHGKLLAQIDPLGTGWDGTYNTRPMPSSDYWFIVNYTDLLSNERVSFNGHFSLIR